VSIDSGDLVDSILTEQARINAAVDDGDIANAVADAQSITGEKIGFVTETVAGIAAGVTPHLWDDGQTTWGFFRWV
jgi:hypothetical protein